MTVISPTENIQVTVHLVPVIVKANCMLPCDSFILEHAFFAYNNGRTRGAYKEYTDISFYTNMCFYLE